MRLLPNGSVYLEEGETAPVSCRCGALYPPERGSECSDCPTCGRLNHHETMPGWFWQAGAEATER